MKPSKNFTFLGWILVGMMALYFLLITVPDAKGYEPTPRARLLLEIKDEKLRIFKYETLRMLCHVSIVDVKMIGSQVSISCVRKDAPKYIAPIRIGPPLR